MSRTNKNRQGAREVVAEEDWKRAVVRMPRARPSTGLLWSQAELHKESWDIWGTIMKFILKWIFSVPGKRLVKSPVKRRGGGRIGREEKGNMWMCKGQPGQQWHCSDSCCICCPRIIFSIYFIVWFVCMNYMHCVRWLCGSDMEKIFWQSRCVEISKSGSWWMDLRSASLC